MTGVSVGDTELVLDELHLQLLCKHVGKLKDHTFVRLLQDAGNVLDKELLCRYKV